MSTISFEPIAILISTLVGGGLGALWYSPVLFGNAWMSALGKTQEDLGSPGPAMAGSIFSCLVAACAMDFLVAATGTVTVTAGLGLGCVVGLGVVAMTMLSDALFSGWGWPLYFIQMSYRALYLVLMGGISGGLRAM